MLLACGKMWPQRSTKHAFHTLLYAQIDTYIDFICMRQDVASAIDEARVSHLAVCPNKLLFLCAVFIVGG